jgi:exosortase A-associated hydrolase 2
MTVTQAQVDPPAVPFFLGHGHGQRFCLFHQPVGTCRGAILYVHPFAEELNRTRRMAALQARRFAALGYGVLQIDLTGCGDSAGDFADARWDLWKQDLAAAAAWLHARLDRPVTLWGLRLGALLALDYAGTATHPLDAILLWQPVTNASTHLTQFLRLRAANAMLDGDKDSAGQHGTRALRDALRDGRTLEIAGYDLSPELALAIDALPPLDALLDALPAPLAGTLPVHWFAVLGAGQTPPPDAARVAASRSALRVHTVEGPPFWATTEIATSPALLDATAGILTLEMPVHAG